MYHWPGRFWRLHKHVELYKKEGKQSESIKLTAIGLNKISTSEQKFKSWLEVKIALGDEITFKVVDIHPDQIDKPKALEFNFNCAVPSKTAETGIKIQKEETS